MTLRAFLSSSRPGLIAQSTTRQSHPSPAQPTNPAWRRLTALSLAALLLPFAQLDLFAQQAPQTNPGYPQQQQDYPPPPPDYPQSQSSPQQQDVPPPPPDYPQSQPPQSQPGQQQPYPQQPDYQQQTPPPNDAQPQPNSQYDQQYAPQYPQQEQPPPYPDQSYNQPPPQPLNQPQSQGLGPDRLDQLVAPIALYPDTLIAQILAASTFPTQVAEADHWRQSQLYAAPADIAAGANAQPWDPSIKALTAFPQVLAQLDRNLSWTTELGNAYYNQPQDVFDAIQAMRQRAQAAGTLQSTPQETVTDDQGYIALAPANPQIVYVPTYDPWVAYGAPIAPWPGFAVFGAIGGFGLRFGPGIVVSAFLGMPWGWAGWGLSWLGHCLFFGHQGWYPHSPYLSDWGLAHGGPRGYWGRAAYAHYYNHGYARGNYYGRPVGNNYNRGFAQNRAFGETRGFNESRGFAQTRSFDNRSFNNNRAFAGPRSSFANRPGYAANYGRQQAFNNTPAFNARSGYSNQGRYGSNFDNRGQLGYRSPEAGRPSQSYSQSYRSPAQSYNRPTQNFGQTYNQSNNFARGGYNNSFRQPQSSFRESTPTYRAYAGSPERNSFNQSSRAFSGYSGHSGNFGGGHAESTPRYSSHSFSGGGHSSFGGGSTHFSGGGHSGAGSHSGHSSGGGGHHH